VRERPAAVVRIDKAGAAELDVGFGRVLTASSLDEVLEAKGSGIGTSWHSQVQRCGRAR
jgi:hypothetical protein